ncbi:MAG: bi-domain-containing oxidoreductase [Candidimonas sp.]|nr:bi-domain-containing oxidoreductase [Candidimonas sp.]
MKQILQDLNHGGTSLADVPVPGVIDRHVHIQTTVSLISAGTERMLVEFGKAGLLQKARQQPEKVRMVLQKARTDGIAATYQAVQSKLRQPLALGYCNVGRVSQLGHGVKGLQVGDRVISNGKHAEFVVVPQNLCAVIPENVSDENAAFVVVAAIGLQGIRLLQPTLGECVVVFGLGLIGLLTVQMLRAQGCRVLGVDFNSTRLDLARQFGADVVNPAAGQDVIAAAQEFSRGRGVDGVIIAATTTSNEPIAQAAQMCRKRGRIVLVGVAGLELSRADFYEKELSFQVSCSYGPGRYDPAYEEGGRDYPVGFVRWTEQRNFEAVLDLMSAGVLDPSDLISHRYAFEQAEQAYTLLSSGASSLGIILKYRTPGIAESNGVAQSVNLVARKAHTADNVSVAFLGAGNYAGRMLIPAFKKAQANLHCIVSGAGVSAVHYGKKFGFSRAATDETTAIVDDVVDAVVIATRHNQHAHQVTETLRAGKHVFCEKPLCLTEEELQIIEAEASQRPSQLVMVGFNRRFAPQIVKMKSLLSSVSEPKNFIMTVNSGAIPIDHWTQDPLVGGGRILGEACHFIDLLRHLAGVPIVRHHAVALGQHSALLSTGDKATITLEFSDGSVGTIFYLANGATGFPKERLEVFCSGKVLQLDNFRTLRGWGWTQFSRMHLWRQDKGQVACARAFVQAIEGGTGSPIPFEEIVEVSRVSIQVARNLV